MDEGLSFSDIFDDSIPYEQKPPEMLTPMEESDFDSFRNYGEDYPARTKELYAGLWEEEILNEAHLRDLYHATNVSSLLEILQDNAIKLTFSGATAADEFYNKGYPFYLSTMRQKYGNFARGFGGPFSGDVPGMYDVIIHLNGDAIKNNGFKTVSMDYWAAGPERSEQEERIVSDKDSMKPLSKFIVDVHVYVQKDLKLPFTIDKMHKISKLANEKNIKVYFYPPNTKDYFRAHRTEKAVTDVSKILAPAEFSADDLDYLENQRLRREKWGPMRPKDLEAFVRIYKGDYSKLNDKNFNDERVLRMLLYYNHDIYATLQADAHNHKREHLPIYKELVLLMKQAGVKTLRDLITLGIEKAKEKNQRGEINEVEDMFRPGRKVATTWEEAKGIFLILNDGKIIVMEDQRTDKYHFYCNDPQIEKLLNRTDFQQYAYKGQGFNDDNIQRDEYQSTHTRLITYLEFAFSRILDRTMKPNEIASMITISARVWEFPEITLTGFWQDKKTVKANWNSILWALHKLSIDEKESVYTFNAKVTNQYTYDEVMNNNNYPQMSKAEKNELQLKKLIHLNPGIKRDMLKMGSNRLQDYADKIGIPLIQLKHLLGSMDENMDMGQSSEKYEISKMEELRAVDFILKSFIPDLVDDINRERKSKGYDNLVTKEDVKTFKKMYVETMPSGTKIIVYGFKALDNPHAFVFRIYKDPNSQLMVYQPRTGEKRVILP